MEQKLDTKEEFSIIKRAKSFTHAGRGIWVFIKGTHNAWLHIAVLIIAIALRKNWKPCVKKPGPKGDLFSTTGAGAMQRPLLPKA